MYFRVKETFCENGQESTGLQKRAHFKLECSQEFAKTMPK